MQNLLLLAALTLGATHLARADYLDWDDVPSQCQDICRPVVEISDSCDAQHDDDDQELSCICNANNMNNQIPECELCVRPFHQADDDDFEEILDLLNDCRFSTLQQSSNTGSGTSTPASSTITTEVNGTPTTSVVASQQSGGNQGNGAGSLAAGSVFGAIAAGVAVVGGAL